MLKKGLKTIIDEIRKGQNVTSQNAEETYNALNKYAKDLNKLASTGKLDPVIGRKQEIERVIHILSRRTKNNPVLIGEPGVGKTAVIEGLAQKIINNEVPEILRGKRIISIEMSSLLAGAIHRGTFEQRIKDIISEVHSAKGQIILFIDELHTIVGSAGGQDSLDAGNILKPYFKFNKKQNSEFVIEFYDISNTGDQIIVGSLVTLVGGKKTPSLYKKFKINIKKQDDFLAMQQMLQRRLKHLEDWGTPDLIVIDGGKGQLSAVRDYVTPLGIPLIGLAKQFETIIICDGKKFKELSVKQQDASLLLLQKGRDETHRFGVTYNRKLRGKAFLPKKL